MKRKRATSSRSPTQYAKSVKPAPKPFPLLSLPPELLDVILSHVLCLPLGVEDGCLSPSLTLKFPFLISILHVCRELRQKGRALVAKKCIWISLTAKGRVSKNLLKNIEKAEYGKPALTTMPLSFRQILPQPTSSTIQIILDDTKPTRHPRKAKSSNEGEGYLLIPYNHSNWARLVLEIWERNRKILNMTLQLLSPTDKFRTRLFEFEMLPSLFLIDSVPVMHVEAHDYPELEERFSRRTEKYNHVTIRDLLAKARFMEETANVLETEGRYDEAAFWLCSCGNIFQYLPMHLIPSVQKWWYEEVDPDLLDDEGFPDDHSGRNAYGNEVRTLVHRIEYRACLAFWNLFKKHGLIFIFCYYKLFTFNGARWWNNDFYPTFGLSDKERAEYHHAKALSRLIKIEAFNPTEKHPDYLPDPEYAYDDLGCYPPDKEPIPQEYHGESVLDMKFALALDPGNEAFSALYTELLQCSSKPIGPGFPNWVAFANSVDAVHELDVIHPGSSAVVNMSHWKGDLRMLDHWGFTSLVRFHHTREMLKPGTESEADIA